MKTLPAKFLFLFVYLLVFGWWGTLFAQALNFTPLERGDYSEEEQKLFVLRGVEITGDFGMGLWRNDFSDLGAAEGKTQYQEDFRLKFRTVFHRELAMHLTLETLPAQLSGESLRVEDSDNPSHIGDSEPMLLHAREAFLKFKFNPGSSLIFGKQELSLGDRRGKVFSGALPALTYHCKVGTWCMPFGAALLGKSTGDWLIHWALEYTAWDNKAGAFRDRLQVGIFRVFYNESNVPLGLNRGPGTYDPTTYDPATYDPDIDTAEPGQGQAVDDNTIPLPIFYDTDSYEYYGLRINWESGRFFWNFDLVFNDGARVLHAYRGADGELAGQLKLGAAVQDEFRQAISGTAMESEIGYRWPTLRLGARLLTASGDPEAASGSDLAGDQTGYYEIVPGSYRGARLYFNGSAGGVGTGAGLGHSINNTRMYGFFLEYSDPGGKGMDYTLGIFKLEAINPIGPDAETEIGLEIDNLLSFYLRPSFTLQLELNALTPMGALLIDPNGDSRDPTTSGSLFLQGAIRVVYRF